MNFPQSDTSTGPLTVSTFGKSWPLCGINMTNVCRPRCLGAIKRRTKAQGICRELQAASGPDGRSHWLRRLWGIPQLWGITSSRAPRSAVKPLLVPPSSALTSTHCTQHLGSAHTNPRLHLIPDATGEPHQTAATLKCCVLFSTGDCLFTFPLRALHKLFMHFLGRCPCGQTKALQEGWKNEKPYISLHPCYRVCSCSLLPRPLNKI